jgi:hypothetical protein
MCNCHKFCQGEYDLNIKYLGTILVSGIFCVIYCHFQGVYMQVMGEQY